MSKIVLNDVTNLNALAVINDNFDKIEQELQNKVLYRNNPNGEPNSLETSVDANDKDIFNVRNLSAENFTVNGKNVEEVVDAAIEGVQQSAESALNSAASATASAASALSSANVATSQATIATTQAGIATAAASAASTSATNAANSASSAASSEANATASASSAASSASSASASASAAATSASNAATSASQAASSASSASASASSALASATSAQSSANTATTQASNAATSAANALSSENNAAASASSAATSASNALASAAAAASSASSAATSATNAAASAADALDSKVAAANSAASAAISAASAEQSKIDTEQVAERYQGDKASAPTLRNNGDALQAGDLYFDTTLDEMRVYNGTIWKSAGSTVNGTAVRQTFTATAGQTSFTVTGGYDAGFADVYLNGVKLVNGVDVAVSSGTAVVLTSGAALNDVVDVIAYGSFLIANTYSIAQADAQFYSRTQADARYLQQANANFVPNTGISNVTAGAGQGAGLEIAGNGNTPGGAGSSFFVGQGSTGQAFVAQRANLPLNFSTNNVVRQTLRADGTRWTDGNTLPAFECRAWVNFNGTGTPSIRGSGNVSSVSKLATGIFQVNFQTAMPDTNYSTNVTGTNYSDTTQGYIGTEGNSAGSYASGKTTSSNRVLFTNTLNNSDPISANVLIFR